MANRTVAISAAAGGGKSTIIRHLAARVQAAQTIHFDDTAVEMPTDWQNWLTGGADFNSWKAQPFVERLRQAKRDGGNGVILVEAPLGRAHAESAALLDVVIFIDTPLEVALARFVLRQLNNKTEDLRFLQGYLQGYEPLLREVYRQQQRQVGRSADLIVDGLQPVARIVDTIVDYLAEATVPS